MRVALPCLHCLVLCLAAPAHAQEPFDYQPPGLLQSGDDGVIATQIWVPGMRYPVELSPSYANSQVYGNGGSKGPGGSQCDEVNFSYPWWDNYCEKRSWDMPLCPAGEGHQGQDIRPQSCDDNVHWAVAAESGQITKIGSYSLYLTTDAGFTHRYLHMKPSSIVVGVGDAVKKGDKLGRISNTFFDSSGNSVPTTVHLHYDIRAYVSSVGGNAYVPPYTSLVAAYEDLLGKEAEPCQLIGAEGGVLDNQGPCFFKWGNSKYWREESAGINGHLYWTNAWVSESPGNWARWAIELEESGEFTVEINIVPPWNAAKAVIYRIRHAGSEDTVLLDQSTASGWTSLGTYDFLEGGDQQVDVLDNTGEAGEDLHLTVDAIRLLPVAPPPQPEAPPEPQAQPEALSETSSIEELDSNPGAEGLVETTRGEAVETVESTDAAHRSGSVPVGSEPGGLQPPSVSSRAEGAGGCAQVPGSPAAPVWTLLMMSLLMMSLLMRSLLMRSLLMRLLMGLWARLKGNDS